MTTKRVHVIRDNLTGIVSATNFVMEYDCERPIAVTTKAMSGDLKMKMLYTEKGVVGSLTLGTHKISCGVTVNDDVNLVFDLLLYEAESGLRHLLDKTAVNVARIKGEDTSASFMRCFTQENTKGDPAYYMLAMCLGVVLWWELSARVHLEEMEKEGQLDGDVAILAQIAKIGHLWKDSVQVMTSGLLSWTIT
jgi:hypothetical protein